MREEYKDLPLVNNEAEEQFEMKIEGYTAIIGYKELQDKIALVHTEVPAELEGRGVAAAIVEKTLNYIEERGLKLKPLCPYVVSYLEKNPEWNRLVAE
jgi:uncharacterized protein